MAIFVLKRDVKLQLTNYLLSAVRAQASSFETRSMQHAYPNTSHCLFHR